MQKISKNNFHDIMSITLPAAAEKLLLLFTGMVSMIIVGRQNSDILVAVSTCNTIYGIVQAVFMGLSLGATIHIARQFAARDTKKAESTMFHIILINTFIGVLFSLLLFFGGHEIIRLLFSRIDAKTVDLMVLFLKITLLSIPFIGIDCAISASLRGTGDARLPLELTIIVNIINIIVGYTAVHIFDMGIYGAAAAFLISRSFGGIVRLVLVMSRRAKTELKLNSVHKISFARIKMIFSLGGITMLEQFMLQVGFLGMQVITSHIGKEAIGAYQVANSTINLVYSVTFGFETAAVTLVGAHLGKGERKEAKSTAYNILYLAEGFTCVIGVILYVFSSEFMHLFSTDASLLTEGVYILHILILFIPVTSMFQGISGTLKTGGRAVVVLVLNIIGPWLIRIPLSYVLCVTLNMGVNGLMGGLFADYFVRALCYYINFKREKWLMAKVDC